MNMRDPSGKTGSDVGSSRLAAARPLESGRVSGENPKIENLRELSASQACQRVAIVPRHPFRGIGPKLDSVAL